MTFYSYNVNIKLIRLKGRKEMKRIFTILALSFVCVLCAVSFTACGGMEFKINFIVDGEIYATVNTNGTETIKLPVNPAKDEYTFDGWFWDKDAWKKPFTANSLLDAPLSSDMSVYAKFKPNHTHEYIEQITKEPTCTEKGEKTFTCECEDSYTEEIKELDHDFGAWITTKNPTCMETGIETRYCSRNNTHTETRTVNSLGHDYKDKIIAPTCTEQGYTTHTCSRCDDSYKDNYTNALGHEFTNYVSDNNATIEQDGTKTATCNHGCGENDTITDIGSQLPEITEYFGKQPDGSYYGKVYNTTTSFDFSGKIDCDCEYYVCTDSACTQSLDNNIANLNVGDNLFYILFENGQKTTATVRRRTICTVTFDTLGGTAISAQTVEEDRRISAPKNPMRLGYTFSAWDYNFNEPIKRNTTITAIWNANTNTPYKIEYYLQNLEDDEYTLQENDTEYLTGTTDTAAKATTTKTYEHFTVIENTATANISPDGSTVLQVYYTRDIYTVNISASENITLSTDYSGQYKYGYIIPEITATFNNYLGYEWQGWYNDNEFLTEEFTTPSFTIDKNITHMAQCSVKDEMANFYFISTANTCTIIGVKDNSITEIFVPDYITEIQESAFKNCHQINKITLPFIGKSNGSDIDKSPDYLFGYIFTKSYTENTNQTSQYLGTGFKRTEYRHGIISGYFTIQYYYVYYIPKITDVIIIGLLSAIPSYAFYNASICSISLGKNINTIYDFAFYNCTNLSDIYFDGTKTEWENIEKYENWKLNVPSSCIVHCSNGEIEISKA